MQQPKEEGASNPLSQPPPLMDGSSEEYKFTIDEYPSLRYNAGREPSSPVPKVVCISKAMLKVGRTQPVDMYVLLSMELATLILRIQMPGLSGTRANDFTVKIIVPILEINVPCHICREHAIIYYDWKENIVKITDLKSVNGIFVNGIKVREAQLKYNAPW